MTERAKFRALLVYPNLPLMLVPPLAIALFTRILREEGYLVDLFDTTAYLTDDNISPQNRVKFLQAREFDDSNDLGIHVKSDMLGDFRQKVKDFNPHVLLFSVVEDTVGKTQKLIHSIADLDIPTLLGGVFPTAAPDRCLAIPGVDAIAIGEGEKTIVGFCEAIRTDQHLSCVKGIWYLDTENVVVRNPPNELVDINLIQPDFSLFDPQRFVRPMGGHTFRTFPIETYRGCPYLCTFCNSPMQRDVSKNNGTGNFLRRKNIPMLFKELQEIRDVYDPEFFYFVDDSFLARPKQEINEFCDMYEKIKLPFWFNTRPENCTRESLRRIKKAGCYRISFGVECGNESFRRKVLKRYVSNRQILDSFTVIAESGVPFSINLIIGMPGETRALIFETVELVRQIQGYDSVTVSIFTPYEGTVLRKVSEKNNWLSKNPETVHTTSRSVLDMPKPYLSAQEIEDLMNVLPLYIYFPREEWPQIERAEQNDGEGKKLREHYSRIYREQFLKINQFQSKELIPDNATGCRANELDSYKFIPVQLSNDEIHLLTL